MLGAASVNLDYYGSEAFGDLSDNPLRFNIEGAILVQQANSGSVIRGCSPACDISCFTTDVTFDSLRTPLGLGRTEDAGLAVLLDYDSRDNTFTPNKGRRAGLAVSYFSESLGGDFDYAKFNATSFQYWQLYEQRLTFGLRLEYAFAEEDAPFYSQPWVSLRGIPILRYLGNHVVTAEIEPRWKIDERWSVLGFAGVGSGRERSRRSSRRPTVRTTTAGVSLSALAAARIWPAASTLRAAPRTPYLSDFRQRLGNVRAQRRATHSSSVRSPRREFSAHMARRSSVVLPA